MTSKPKNYGCELNLSDGNSLILSSYGLDGVDMTDTEDDEFITDMGLYKEYRSIVSESSKPISYAPPSAMSVQNDEAIKHLRILVQTGRFAKEAKWFSSQASAEFKAAKEFLESLK